MGGTVNLSFSEDMLMWATLLAFVGLLIPGLIPWFQGLICSL